MLLDRNDISGLIPHAGCMVLLESVLACDPLTLRARAISHRDPGNPLRRGGQLAAVTGAEYAAQAAAVHGALSAGGETRPGFLAMIRYLHWTRDRLDVVPGGDLDIRVELISAQSDSTLYDFTLDADSEPLLRGRLAVFFPRQSTSA